MEYISGFDLVCLTETFLEFNHPLDCFPDFVQFFSPAIKLSQQGRRSGGVMVMAKRELEKHIEVLDLTQDNTIWLKLDKRVFSSDRDVVFCGLYVCPYDSPYYRQDHVSVTSTITIVEQYLLDFIEKHDNYHYLMCGDFNARTGNLNVANDVDDDDDVTEIQSDTFGPRRSEDKVVNSFGRLLLELCAMCNITILNGTREGDQNGHFTYVCDSGCSAIDYFLASRALTPGTFLKVAERFESKHLPVELSFSQPDRDVGAPSEVKFVEKLVWDDSKLSLFQEAVGSTQFESAIAEATALLHMSVDSAFDSFTRGLMQASSCMKRRVYVGPRQSKWFDAECRVAKREMRRWWRQFRQSTNTSTGTAHRLKYVESRRIYRILLKNKKRIYKENKITNLANNAKDSKLFWKEVKSVCHRAIKPPNISSDEWFTHFYNVFNAGQDSEETQTHACQAVPDSVCCLDGPFSAEEVLSAINHLKLKKSPGPDGILAGMLKNSLTISLPFLVEAFNFMFDSGVYPTAWTGAVVVPIHKGGDTNNPDNYRGVSLLSILGKAFSRILNTRLSTWADANNKIEEVQGGFRAGYSTTDNMFVLHSAVHKYLLKKSGKVYVCFVDFRKAFDRVNRQILWNTLKKAGVGVKMLQILQSMYKSVRSCVRCPDNLTEYFDCPAGVRQGCVLSPTLFSFLINELALEIAERGTHGIQLSPDFVQLLIILFADDVALMSYSIIGLQNQINILKDFADAFSMEVNMVKTKIVVFRKGGFLSAREKWKYGNETIEVVNSYKYLGLHFTTKLSLTQAVSELATKAKIRTSRILRCLFRLGDVQRNVFFKIFDAQVMPILMYGAEIWGFQQFGVLEKVHLFACKRFLRVGQQTPNKMIYGDLGRYPLYITSAIRVVKYWLKLIALPHERLPWKAYRMLIVLSDNGKITWVSRLKDLLCENGLAEAWQQQSVGNVSTFLTTLRLRLIDRFQQEWSDAVQSKERFEFYAQFKRVFNPEPYVDCTLLRCFKIAYTQFRFGISPIMIHKMRYKLNVTPSQLLCPKCKEEVEDERHVLFSCNAYNEMRRDEPSLNCPDADISSLMSAVDCETIAGLSKYLYHVFRKRLETPL